MGMLDNWLTRVEELGPIAAKAGDRADKLACEGIDLLKEIRDATQTLYGVDVYEYPRLPFSAADTKIVEGREGYVKVIKQIAVVAPGAVNVDLFLGDPSDTGFLWREPVAAAGRSSRAVEIPTVESSPIYVQASAAAQVNLVIQRIKL